MANGLASGNIINSFGAGSYYGERTQSIPGYDFYMARGYAALSTVAGNRFPIWIPSQEKNQPRKRMVIPKGGHVYHIGLRNGRGVFNTVAGGELVLGAVVNGANVLSQHIVLDTLLASGPLAKKHEIYGGNGIGETVSRTLLLRSARVLPNAWAEADWDAFNSPLAYEEYDSTAITTAVGSAELELQVRDIAGNGLINPAGGLMAAPGLRANADFPSEAYILVQVGYFVPSSDVCTADDFAGVVWDEVFANV